MKTVREFPHAIDEIENLWIPLPGGLQLAARAWIPVDAGPVPAVIEYLPYRKRDRMRERDEPIHRYLAGHGIAALRIDVRGTGDSDGVLADEYSIDELTDGEAAIRWIQEQPWSNGRVGVMGISWGGINALLLAAHAPGLVGAVVSVCSTDDRYADDAHFMGGCLLTENVLWGAVLFTLAALPPDPALSGERWRTMWRERLEGATLYPALWLRHQRRDAYWDQGSLAPRHPHVVCPVLAIGGWADAYTNTVGRLLRHVPASRGLIGPWAHAYPHEGVPGPAIGFLQELVRWWHEHLTPGTRAVPAPRFVAWLSEGPHQRNGRVPGVWIAPHAIEGGSHRELAFTEARVAAPGEARVRAPARLERIASSQRVGTRGGWWCPFGLASLPGDQRPDDALSLVFDFGPFDEDVAVLGTPLVAIELESSEPQALLAVRLNDVTPRRSTRVSLGVLNLAHRRGHERPVPLEPGRRHRAVVTLKDTGYVFRAGHRIRLAISTAYWPILWPSPRPGAVDLVAEGCRLRLPILGSHDPLRDPFPPPEAARGPRTRDLAGGLWGYEDLDLELGHRFHHRASIDEADPLSARIELGQEVPIRRAGWSTLVRTKVTLTASADAFRIRAELRAMQDDAPIFERDWDEHVERDHV